MKVWLAYMPHNIHGPVHYASSTMSTFFAGSTTIASYDS